MFSKNAVKAKLLAIILALVIALGMSWLASQRVNASIKETAMHGKIIVKYSGKGKVHLLNEDGKYIKKYAKKDSKWKVYAKATIRKQLMYRIGKNTWIPAKYTKKASTKTAASAPVQWKAKSSEKGFLVNTSSVGKIIGNKTTKKFYLPGKKNHKILSLNMVFFSSKKEAEEAGYKLAN
ncbi:hypothetical protein FP435_07800 [Lactobacillus sp. PV037]|uniref:SLAP domain-containing protein n=1 Tax=Lactobacillus sp. PV037 TaxID=2594496 RepID=UPI00223FDE12|nr:SLAP domain-containing protein [Lactobacillus sp. PV037]QNQ84327.1 hypothetical protein FP435_07800 [Lactobacillus sp. PV037]